MLESKWQDLKQPILVQEIVAASAAVHSLVVLNNVTYFLLENNVALTLFVRFFFVNSFPVEVAGAPEEETNAINLLDPYQPYHLDFR